jgi:O-antigen ligase
MVRVSAENTKTGFKLEVIILLFVVFAVPLFVIPRGMLNAFHAPKTSLILIGLSILFLIYSARFLLGKKILLSRSSTSIWIIILIAINCFSFLYTKNPYFTKIAFLMNVSSLAFFYFSSLHINRENSKWFLWAICLSGLLVSVVTYLQFTGNFVLFKGVPKDIRVMGTIGNSNYLGAYFIFPLFASAGLVFLLKGKLRFVAVVIAISVLGALLFSRARASWLGFGISFPLYLLILRKIYGFSVIRYTRKNLKRVLVSAVIILTLGVSLWYVSPEKFHTQMQPKNWAYLWSLKYRVKYFRASWWLFKQNPLFGDGLWSYRNQVYRAQAEIYKKDNNFFNDYEKPQPRRVHNEYLEILNDGGIVAAAALLMFFVLIMKHGWRTIRNKDIENNDRVMTATAFSAIIGVMFSALFMFPFRINSTLMLTVLMMGIIEGMYIKNNGNILLTAVKKLPLAYPAVFIIILTLIGALWFGSYKPIKGEIAYQKYRKAMSQRNAEMAKKHVLEAVSHDPGNSLYTFAAGRMYMDVFKDYSKAEHFFESADVNFNGDLIKWVVHYTRGILKYRVGSLFEAREAFKKALYYYPLFKPAQKKLKEVEKIIRENDHLTIRIR